MTLQEALESNLKMIMADGVIDDYQRGYAEAVTYVWDQAGLPHTVEFMAARAMARAPYVDPDE